MKVLITGSQGFIGKNFMTALKRKTGIEIFEFNEGDGFEYLSSFIFNIDFIYHFAGCNRPTDVNDFYSINKNLTAQLVALIQEKELKIPILFTSSIQVENDNDYGKSKLAAENIIETYSMEDFVSVYIYRLPNVFGKWSKPNYNTVIATWCYNVIHGKEIKIDYANKTLSLVYIDDVVDAFLTHLTDDKIRHFKTFFDVKPVYTVTLKEIADYIKSFNLTRESLVLEQVGNGFVRALYATYLSFLPKDDLSFQITSHCDDRGGFIEILKTIGSGQFSISTSKPGVVRGNHYHDTKNEKFLVIKGSALIQFRHVLEEEAFDYYVSDEKYEIVDIPPGYTHKITNIGSEEMILVVWANEVFDINKPDTYYEEV
jgi:UDP-2-acetamido-2,6-beta-L-arabino-hexul-4-ose reductase